MSHRTRTTALASFCAALLGCSTGGVIPAADDAAVPDAGAPVDAFIPPPVRRCAHDPDDFNGTDDCDAGPLDAGTLVLLDAGADAGPDAGVDGGHDAGPPPDAGPPVECAWIPDYYGDDGSEDPPPVDCPAECWVAPRAVDPCVGATPITDAVVEGEVTWSGRLCLETRVNILPGSTLTVAPGAEIYATRNGAIEVNGLLRSVGEPSAPILFSAAGLTPEAGSWSGIAVYLTRGGRVDMRHSTVEYGSYGLTTWESSPFTTVGPETTVDVQESVFRYNDTALGPDDNTRVQYTSVYCNVVGLVVASEDTPIQQITHNNFCHSLEFSMAAMQDGADAVGNHWCSTDPAAIADAIDDLRDGNGNGLITFEPFEAAPIVGAPALP